RPPDHIESVAGDLGRRVDRAAHTDLLGLDFGLGEARKLREAGVQIAVIDLRLELAAEYVAVVVVQIYQGIGSARVFHIESAADGRSLHARGGVTGAEGVVAVLPYVEMAGGQLEPLIAI